mmetsp:Transcript_94622/g.167086  ORF Transcript_94622/g.167086 Transcript_94622/m.167086 type:complete len:278 (-) Transcript_94622:86-919(-)
MRAAALLLLCVACAGDARRMQKTDKQEQAGGSEKSLASLLSALSPAAGWQVNGAGHAMSAPHAARRAEPVVAEEAPWDTAPAGLYAKAEPGSKSVALPFAARPASLDAWELAGDVGFDPFGFSSCALGPFDNDKAHLGWMREAEVKHGRVCMLATIGWILPDIGVRAPGVPTELKDAAVTSFKAHDIAVADGRMLLLLLACGVFEIAGAAGIQSTVKGNRFPGDFMLMGGFKNSSPEKLKSLQQAEIKHGRLAMMAFSGIVTQVGLTNGALGFPYVR